MSQKWILCFVLILGPIFGAEVRADVYPDTVNQRREPTALESQYLLHLGALGKGGCSASALTPDILITAEHCISISGDARITEGYFEADPNHTFQIIGNPLDVSSRYANDVVIYKIKWNTGSAPNLLRYPKELAASASQLKYGVTDQEGTKLFTLGYPHDREKRATYSWGYLRGEKLFPEWSMIDPYTKKKTAEALYLKVNVPLLNGNSGGPVYTENFKLVGIVHGGASITMEKATSTAPEHHSQNPEFWNLVGALHYVYPQMKTLQKLFPNGVNPNVDENGAWIGPAPTAP